MFWFEIRRGCEPPLDYLAWYTPRWPVALAFLPRAEPWSTYAYVHTLYGTDHDLVVAAARRWHERYGAEPVAAWGTMTQLLVSRRPAEPEEALRLAVEQVVLARDTIGPLGIPLRWHARRKRVVRTTDAKARSNETTHTITPSAAASRQA